MADLIPTASKSDNEPSKAHREHAAAVARLKSLNEELAGINRGAGAAPAPAPNSSGVAQVFDTSPTVAPAPVLTKKSVNAANLHPRAKAVASSLSADAAALYDLVLRADDHYRGGQLVDLSVFVIKAALDVTMEQAAAARSELLSAGHIKFQDNGAGVRGYRPRSN